MQLPDYREIEVNGAVYTATENGVTYQACYGAEGWQLTVNGNVRTYPDAYVFRRLCADLSKNWQPS